MFKDKLETCGLAAAVPMLIGGAWLWSQPLARFDQSVNTLRRPAVERPVGATTECRSRVAKALDSRRELVFGSELDSVTVRRHGVYQVSGNAQSESSAGHRVALDYTCTFDARSSDPVKVEIVEHSL